MILYASRSIPRVFQSHCNSKSKLLFPNITLLLSLSSFKSFVGSVSVTASVITEPVMVGLSFNRTGLVGVVGTSIFLFIKLFINSL